MVSKFAPFARGAAAAKTLFTQSGNTQMPGFFMSTPQFNRQKSQVGFYMGEAHRQSFGLDTGAVVVGPGQSYSTATAANNDDDDKDKQRSYPSVQTVKRGVEVQNVEAAPEAPEGVKNVLADFDEVAEDEVDVDVRQLNLLLSQGRHTEVLDYLDGLESSQKHVSVESYNLALLSLVELSLTSLDFTPVLEAYQRMIQREDLIPETYAVVLSGLVRMTRLLEQRLEELETLLGPQDSRIESVGEILSSVPIADHLKIAVSILRAVDAKVDQALYDELVYMCCKHNIDVDDLLSHCTQQAPKIMSARSFEEAQTAFNADTASLNDKMAYMDVCFKFKNPDAAIALESEATRDHITLLLAKHGFVSTSWARMKEHPPCFNTQCNVLSEVCSHNILSTATLIFDRVIAHKKSRAGVWCRGRSAYIRLCTRMNDEDLLLDAIKESNLRVAIWDPATILTATEFLANRGHSMLAVDLFVQQTQRLHSLWRNNDLKSFSGSELMNAFMECLKKAGGQTRAISVSQALVLAQTPLILESVMARHQILQIIWDARLSGSPEYVDFMAETPEALAKIISVHSDFIRSSESHFGLKLPFDVQDSLHRVYPLLVSDIMSNQLPFPREDAPVIARCLELLKINTAPWEQHCKSLAAPSAKCSEVEEATIRSYIYTNNGIDTAIELFERQLMLQTVPSGTVLAAIVTKLVELKDAQRFIAFRTQVLNRIDLYDKTTCVSYLKAFILGASLDPKHANDCNAHLKKLGAIPCVKGFIALISTTSASKGLALFREAKANGISTSELYDATLQALANARQIADIESLFNEMGERIVPTATTFRVVLDAYLAADKEVAALELMEKMFQFRTGYERTTQPYNKLLEYYVFKKQDRKAALKIFAYMKNAGVLLSPQSYKLLMETWLLKPMSLQKAEHVLETMKLEEAPASTLHFSTLLKARGILDRDLESAQAFYRGLVKNSRLHPDQHIFAALVMSYVVNGKKSELPKVFDEMAKFNVSTDNVAREIQRSY